MGAARVVIIVIAIVVRIGKVLAVGTTTMHAAVRIMLKAFAIFLEAKTFSALAAQMFQTMWFLRGRTRRMGGGRRGRCSTQHHGAVQRVCNR